MGKCLTVILFLLITNCLLLSSLSVNRSYYSDNDDGDDSIDTNRTSYDGAQNNESASLLSLLLKHKQKRQGNQYTILFTSN